MTWEWSWYTWAWIILLSSMVVLEVVALIDPRKNDTLSAHAIFVMRARKLVRVAVILFLVWVTIHWATGGWI